MLLPAGTYSNERSSQVLIRVRGKTVRGMSCSGTMKIIFLGTFRTQAGLTRVQINRHVCFFFPAIGDRCKKNSDI